LRKEPDRIVKPVEMNINIVAPVSLLHDEVTIRLNSESAGYHLVQNVCLLSINQKIITYRAVMLSVVLNGYDRSTP
jgi:hypothetical protein